MPHGATAASGCTVQQKHTAAAHYAMAAPSPKSPSVAFRRDRAMRQACKRGRGGPISHAASKKDEIRIAQAASCLRAAFSSLPRMALALS